MLFVLETVLIISASRCTSGDFSSFFNSWAFDQSNVADRLGVYEIDRTSVAACCAVCTIFKNES